MEDQVREAILTELKRQSAEGELRLRDGAGADEVQVEGTIDVEALTFVVVGSLAGGP